ncbi:SpoIIE family protein phosphatase [Geobacter hydrogenophilus]|uniref:Sodium/solute symporter serine/threonine phosphatase n=1 Tax=Geobacter hydrogenophilus TaxID=40983 RepID=A0A9W6G1S3_9BACT|nr:SpoIIE family protein phosphatase [Geobacter hydrogenophilus]MBT0895598.1 SpoIIE family protein phosphatase [Geobacter hydrogenophilus]GLI39289.1 sodium/solute symporter serine/threonine phosphatase [Geobacter hydrogenophilus]
MIPIEIVSTLSLLYIGLLYAVAYFADRRHEAGRSIVANSFVYSLSLAVIYTSWTFYGSVGRAATSGIEFLTDSLGITLMAFCWWFLLRKMVRVSKEQNVRSIADFISSRYGKSPLLGAIVTIIVIAAFPPYIALQLKAVAHTFDLLTKPPHIAGSLNNLIPALPPFADTAFIVTLFLALFGVLFGARHLDVSERHEGLVAAIALQSVVKLVAFVTVGIFVTYGLFDGFGDIFSRFAAQFPDRTKLFLVGPSHVTHSQWFSRLFMIMISFMFLPRMFHVMVIENADEGHIKDAMWHLPTYAFLLALFVMPVALGGIILSGGDTAMADFFVIHLPLESGHPWLALLAFIGGFSASAGMVIVESVVLSTMILDHLALPVILKLRLEASDISRVLLNTKRAGIIAVVFFGYLYYRFISESYALINTGVVTFIAVAQFAPSVIGGLFWKRANRRGALTGIVLGFVVWFYTLLIPLFVNSDWLPGDLLDNGPFGLGFLRPLELFGLSGLDMISHSLFWTLFFNLGAFIAFSLLSDPDDSETEQAVKFVDVFEVREEPVTRKRMSKSFAVVEFVDLMTKFIGQDQAHAAIARFLEHKQIDEKGSLSEYELPILKRYTEKVLAGSVGAASAGIIVDSYLAARGSELEDVFDIFGTVSLSRTASREQLGVLYEAARLVAGKSDLKTILDSILELLQQQFKFDTCVIRILDEEMKTLTVQSQKGMSSDHLNESDRELSRGTYSGEAFLTNSAVVVNDADSMDKPASALVARREGIRSFAHAPITVEGKPVGILSAFSKSRKGIFTDEFVELFTNLAGQIGIALRNALQAEKLIQAKEHEKEMQIARTIQMGLLPTRAPDVAGISLAGTCVPAREVGGDYYDFLARGATGLDLVIADVSGHNVGAALLMAEVRTIIQAEAKIVRGPGEILGVLNDFLYEDLTRAELFITMFYLNYDAGTRLLSFASAGHNPPILRRSGSRACEYLDAEGLILGIKRKIAFEEKQVRLEPGDILLLYTDGITEAANPAGELFGEDRLCSLLAEYLALHPQQIIDNLLAEVRSFAANQNLTDDVSLVVLKAL